MRITSRRLLLPLVAVLVAAAVIGVVALLGGDRHAAEAERSGPDASTAPGPAGAPSIPRQGAAVPGDPAGNPDTAGLPRVAGTATTTDLVMVWDGRGSLPPASARSGPTGLGAAAQIKLDLTVGPAAGRALAVVRVRNLTTRRLALIGTIQLLVSGPGPAAVSRLRLNRPLAAGGASQVTMALQPGSPGVYRVRAVFTP
jgi:hypothetical protein